MEINTARSNVAMAIDPIASFWPTLERAHRLLSTMLDPLKEKETVESTATTAANHHTEKMRLAHLDSQNALLTRTRNKNVPIHVVVVARELRMWTKSSHRFGPSGVTESRLSIMCRKKTSSGVYLQSLSHTLQSQK